MAEPEVITPPAATADTSAPRKFGDGPVTGTVAPKPWNSHIQDENIRNSPTIAQMSKITSHEDAINSLANQLVNAQKAMGAARTEVPNQNWTKEQVKKWNQEVRGVPATPDAYKLEAVKPPPNVALPPEVQQEYVKAFHELDLDDRQVAGVLNKYYERIGSQTEAQSKEASQKVQVNTQTMQQEWGGNYEFNVEIAERGLQKHADPELLAVLQSNPQIMSLPSVQRMFYELGRLEMDDTLRTGDYSSMNGVSKVAKIQEEITNLESGDLYNRMLANKTTNTETKALVELKARRTNLYKELALLKTKKTK